MAKILIDLNEHTINCAKCGQGIGWMSNAQLEEAIKNGVVIPDNATNGDVIKALFSHISVKDNCQKYYSVDIENLSKDKSFNTIGFRKDWWNTPYKVGDTDEN